jgi:hypothetical protein
MVGERHGWHAEAPRRIERTHKTHKQAKQIRILANEREYGNTRTQNEQTENKKSHERFKMEGCDPKEAEKERENQQIAHIYHI